MSNNIKREFYTAQNIFGFDKTDILKAYKFLLNRLPESDIAIQHYLKFPSLEAVYNDIKLSDEFSILKKRNDLNISKNGQMLSNGPDSYNRKILFVGNCQVTSLAKLCNAMSTNVSATAIHLSPSYMKSLTPKVVTSHNDSIEVIWVHASDAGKIWIASQVPRLREKIKLLPQIDTLGFHPDCDYINSFSENIRSPIGAYHSALIFWSWKNGFTIEQALDFFSEDVFEYLGYFDYHLLGLDALVKKGLLLNFPISNWIARWERRGSWMHTINHPKLFVLADIAKYCVEYLGLDAVTGVDDVMTDDFGASPCWPVYPAIAERLSINAGSYNFKLDREMPLADGLIRYMGLQQFASESFNIYEKYARDELHSSRLSSVAFQGLEAFLRKRTSLHAFKNVSSNINANPYSGLPDHQFWRRSIERVVAKEVDPVVAVRFNVGKSSKVATAGSCFAQHIARTLAASGFNYFVTERGDDLSADERKRQNYGVFSARFGNVYTARQLVQLQSAALGIKPIPDDLVWRRDDTRYIDALRPYVEPDGFASVADVLASRSVMLACVKQMMTDCDVFIFTLGLTEHWYRKCDGYVFPVAPGVVTPQIDHDEYAFGNFDVAETTADMQSFLLTLKAINPKVKVILTVSPVPLVATYEPQSVLVSTTYSKAVLRVVANELVKKFYFVDYFPSYEVITGIFNQGSYYDTDLRSIKPAGVDHVMRLFMKHFTDNDSLKLLAPNAPTDYYPERRTDMLTEIKAINELVCDEENIDNKNFKFKDICT